MPITTAAGRPNPPTQPVLSTKGDNNQGDNNQGDDNQGATDRSLCIAWSYVYDSTSSTSLPSTSNGAVVASFEIESLELTNVHYSEWSSVGTVQLQTQRGGELPC